MQFIIDLVKANSDDEGKVDFEKLETAVKAEFPKQAVPKEQYNTVADKLKSANDTLTKLQDENKDIEALQTQIDEYKKTVEQKEAELIKTRNETTLREALREAGATDIDYMIFKLGELETDDEGNYKDLDNKIKGLKEADPKWFGTEDKKDEGDDPQDKNGYQPIDNKLPNGKPKKGGGEPANLTDAIKQHYNKK